MHYLAQTRRISSGFTGVIAVILAAITLVALYNVLRGTPTVTLGDLWQAIVYPVLDGENPSHFLIRELRIPRVLLAVICGAALGCAGVLLQDSLRNPLADPGLLGIAQGASLMVALQTIYPEVTPDWSRPVLCLVAGVVAGSAVILFSGSIRNPVRVILAGAIFSTFFATLTSVILLLAPYARSNGLGAYYRYVIGSVSAAEWANLEMVFPWLLIGLPIALLSGRMLNLLQMGDEIATGAGLNPFRTRVLMFLLALILISPVIAAIGPIAFIALFAPHIARGLLATSDARRVLVVAALAGAGLLLAADTIGRLLFYPLELPAGLWTMALIGPAAIAVVGRKTRRLGA